MVGVRGSLGSSLLFLASMIGVFCFFLFLSREDTLREMAESRRKMPFPFKRTLDEEVIIQRRLFRYVVLPMGAVCVVVAFVCVLLSIFS